jgi:hypothetical protein
MVLSATVLRPRDAQELVSASARSSASVGLLLCGLTTALVAQGAYYTGAQLLVAAALVLSVAVAPPRRRRPHDEPARCRRRYAVAGAAAVALAAWAVLRGLVEPDPWSGLRLAALVAGLVAVSGVVRRTDLAARVTLERGVVALCLVVAVAGWAGVVWHLAPWGLTNDGVWRAASTLTYANATAAVLGAALLAVAARDVGAAQRRTSTVVLTVLMVGLGATMSRGGFLALTVGLVVLAVVQGVRRVARVLIPPAAGAAVALSGLLPSMPVTSAAGQPAAVVALPAGVAVACLLPSAVTRARGVRRPGLAVAVSVLLVVGAGVAAAVQLAAPIGEVAAWRAHVTSPARVDAGRAALSLAADHPWAGVGPGAGWTTWRDADGSRATMRYVHDEYLQVLVDVGLPGLVLLLTCLAAAAWALAPAARRSGAAAGALALINSGCCPLVAGEMRACASHGSTNRTNKAHHSCMHATSRPPAVLVSILYGFVNGLCIIIFLKIY